jgi:hypothetical protein
MCYHVAFGLLILLASAHALSDQPNARASHNAPVKSQTVVTPTRSNGTSNDLAPITLNPEHATPVDILRNAYRVAGGEIWRRPKTLHMVGTSWLYQDGQASQKRHAEHYEMWREYPNWNESAHAPSGKVRIEARSADKILFQVAFDGKNTYNQKGLVPGQEASKEWSEAFGFGIIRFALDAGFRQT